MAFQNGKVFFVPKFPRTLRIHVIVINNIPTFGSLFVVNVGKNTYHTWILYEMESTKSLPNTRGTAWFKERIPYSRNDGAPGDGVCFKKNRGYTLEN